jgi:glycerol uptake facilitator-like aquaporin
MENMKKYLDELLGTFVLVFIGTGSAVVAGKRIGLSDEQNVYNSYHIAVAQRVSETS